MSKLQTTLAYEKRVRGGVTAPPQQLTGLDLFHSFAFFPTVLVYNKGLDLEHAEKCLRETLKHFPPVGGRYKKDAQGNVYVDSNDSGVDFRVYKAKGKLPYGAHNLIGKETSKLYKAVLPWRVVGQDVPFLQFNFHVFEDGGVVVCSYCTHSIADGGCFWAFMREWSNACLGKPITGPASFDRSLIMNAGQEGLEPNTFDLVESLSTPKLVSTFAKMGWRAVTNMSSWQFRLSGDVLRPWYEAAMMEAGPGGSPPSLGSIVSAYVLKGISPALPPDVDRTIGMVRDLRYTKDLGLPKDYFGNALCYAGAKFTPQQLATENLTQLARRCRPPAEEVNAASVKKMLSTMEQHRKTRDNWRLMFKPTLETLRGGLIVNNCIPFPIYEIDFGSGPPDWYEMPPATIRLLLLVQTPKKDGLDLLLAASKEEIDALKAQCKADGINTSLV